MNEFKRQIKAIKNEGGTEWLEKKLYDRFEIPTINLFIAWKLWTKTHNDVCDILANKWVTLNKKLWFEIEMK